MFQPIQQNKQTFLNNSFQFDSLTNIIKHVIVRVKRKIIYFHRYNEFKYLTKIERKTKSNMTILLKFGVHSIRNNNFTDYNLVLSIILSVFGFNDCTRL